MTIAQDFNENIVVIVERVPPPWAPCDILNFWISCNKNERENWDWNRFFFELAWCIVALQMAHINESRQMWIIKIDLVHKKFKLRHIHRRELNKLMIYGGLLCWWWMHAFLTSSFCDFLIANKSIFMISFFSPVTTVEAIQRCKREEKWVCKHVKI
jgi:hypothetical protein